MGDGSLERTSLDEVTLWARHPRSAGIVEVTSWRDVRRLERAGRGGTTGWDQRVVVVDTATGPSGEQRAAVVSALLAAGTSATTPGVDSGMAAGTSSGVSSGEASGVEGVRVVRLDENLARGRQQIVPGSAAPDSHGGLSINDAMVQHRLGEGTLARLDELVWLEDASLTRGQPELRRRGVKVVAQRLFPNKAHRNVVAALGHALLRRGPTGAFGNRYHVVVLATMASPLLSADRIADVLGWPLGPALRAEPGVALGVEQMLAPLDELRRHQLLEALAIAQGRSGTSLLEDHPFWGQIESSLDPLTLGGINQDYAERLMALMVRYNPDAAGALSISDSLQPTVPFRAEHQVMLAGVLTAMCGDAGVELPKLERGWWDYLAALVEAAAPLPICWEWAPEVIDLTSLSVAGFADVALVLPGGESVLVRWGRDMGNCVGTYDLRVQRGQCVLLGIERDGALVGNLSIERDHNPVDPEGVPDVVLDAPQGGLPPGAAEAVTWTITECLGRFNARLPADLEQALRTTLTPALATLPASARSGSHAVVPGGAVAVLGGRLPAQVRPASTEPSLDLEDVVAGGPPDLQRRGPVRRRSAATLPDHRSVSPAGQWGDPQARAVVGGVDGGADRFVTDAVATALVPDVDAEVARGLLAVVLATTDPPRVSDVVALMAHLDPANAWLRPGSVAGLRALLDELIAGHAEAIDGWDDVRPFEADAEANAVVRHVISAWAAGRVHRGVARVVWDSGAVLRLRLGGVHCLVSLHPSGAFDATDSQGYWLSRNQHQRLASMIGTPPPPAGDGA